MNGMKLDLFDATNTMHERAQRIAKYCKHIEDGNLRVPQSLFVYLVDCLCQDTVDSSIEIRFLVASTVALQPMGST